ncbi:MAG: PorV/PorQ family protein [bacterium]|nr:PorV/PorQ family protein [bacterium]
MRRYFLLTLLCAMCVGLFSVQVVAQSQVIGNFPERTRQLDPIVPQFEEAAPSFIKSGQAGFSFLSLPTDARTAALAGAGVGTIGSASGILYNPAALAFMEGREAFFTYTSWIVETKNYVTGVAVNIPGRGTFGLAVQSYDAGDFNRTSIDTNPAGTGFLNEGTFTTTNWAVSGAYSLKVTDRFSVGTAIRWAHQDLGSGDILRGGQRQTIDNSKDAFAFDLGTYFNTGFRNTVLAMSVQNFSSEIVYQREQFELPRTIRLGLLIDVLSVMGNTPVPHHFDVSVDVNNPIDYDERILLGVEYTYQAAGSPFGFSLRGGYKTNHDTESFSAGGGLMFRNEGGKGFKIDYAFKAFESKFFDSVHIVSGSVDF